MHIRINKSSNYSRLRPHGLSLWLLPSKSSGFFKKLKVTNRMTVLKSFPTCHFFTFNITIILVIVSLSERLINFSFVRAVYFSPSLKVYCMVAFYFLLCAFMNLERMDQLYMLNGLSMDLNISNVVFWS